MSDRPMALHEMSQDSLIRVVNQALAENDALRVLLRDLLRAAEQGGWEGGLSAIERARKYFGERT